MIYFRNLRKIRKRYGLTQEELANKLGVSEAYISSLEDSAEETVQVTSEFIAKLRDVFDLHGIPLTDDEKMLFYDELNNLRLSIDYGYMNKAKEIIPGLAQRAEASCHQSFINLCDLHIAHYFQSVNSTKAYKAYNKVMASLNDRRTTFDSRHHYYYHLLLGTQAYKARDYDKALASYIKAEKLDKQSKLREVSFYYMCGKILSDMGYTARAVEYHKKAVHYTKWNKGVYGRPNSRYDVQIDSYLSYNLSKTGQGEEALAILNKRLKTETKKESANEVIGAIYFSLGRVQANMEYYVDAEVSFETALLYLSKDSETYIPNLYHKAKALIAQGRTKEAVTCLDEGLGNPIDEMWRYLFESLKHSTSLSDDKSMLYMTETVLPKLLEYGCNEEAISYYKVISQIYAKAENYKQALVYSGQASAITDKLLASRVEKGL